MTTFEEALDKVLALDRTLSKDKPNLDYANHEALKSQMNDNEHFLAWKASYALYLAKEIIDAIVAGDPQELATTLHAAIGSTMEMGILIGITIEKQELPAVTP